MRCPRFSTWAVLPARWCLAIGSTTGCPCGARGYLAWWCWAPGFTYSRGKITDMGTVGQREEYRRGKQPQVPAKAVWPCATAVGQYWQAGANRPKPCGVLRYIWILLMALTACNFAETRRPTIDPALVALVPPDATMLAGLRLADIRATPLYRKLLAGKHLDRLDQFGRQTGVHPRLHGR